MHETMTSGRATVDLTSEREAPNTCPRGTCENQRTSSGPRWAKQRGAITRKEEYRVGRIEETSPEKTNAKAKV